MDKIKAFYLANEKWIFLVGGLAIGLTAGYFIGCKMSAPATSTAKTK